MANNLGGLQPTVEKIFGKGFTSLDNPSEMIRAVSKKWDIPSYRLKPGMFPTISEGMLSKMRPGYYRPQLQSFLEPQMKKIKDEAYYKQGSDLVNPLSHLGQAMSRFGLEQARGGAFEEAAAAAGQEETILQSMLNQMLFNVLSL